MNINERILPRAVNTSRGVLALGEAVNLNLATQISAYEGNETVRKIYQKVLDFLPKSLLDTSPSPYNAVHSFLISNHFISLVSLVEIFLFDVARIILEMFPEKLPDSTIKAKVVISMGSVDAVRSYLIDKHINEISYKKPMDYISALCDIFSCSPSIFGSNVAAFVEIKARRDIGVHSAWKKNSVYEKKLYEAGIDHAKFPEYLYVDNEYFMQSVSVIHEIIDALKKHCSQKFA